MDPSRPLGGRLAFVTGAARGIGCAIARAFAQAGATTWLADVDPAVQAAAEELRAGGLAAQFVALDVRDEAAFDSAVQRACEREGVPLGILVNNAARTPTTSPWELPLDEWDEVLAVNLRGTFIGCRVAGRRMREAGSGRILNLGSLAGAQASAATGVHYAASKAGIAALTRAFAQELAPHGVTVNTLAPAAIEGPMLASLPPPQREALARSIPLGRFGRADEVAAAAVWLASPAAGFVTGATLDLNGGRLMR